MLGDCNIILLKLQDAVLYLGISIMLVIFLNINDIDNGIVIMISFPSAFMITFFYRLYKSKYILLLYIADRFWQFCLNHNNQ